MTSRTKDTFGSLRRLKALIVKEFFQIVRDPSSILIAFVLPMILLFLFGYGISLDARDVRLGIAMEDSGEDAQSLTLAFLANPFFEARVAKNHLELEPDLISGRLRGIIVIPQDFGRKLKSGRFPAGVQLIADGSETNTANYVENYARGVLNSWLMQRQLAKGRDNDVPVLLVSRVFYNKELDSRNSLVPGSLAIIMAIIGTLLTALVVAREWEKGTMESLLATPVRIFELILGKLIPYFCLGMGSMSVSTVIAVFLFEVPFRGSAVALLVVSSSFLLAALGQGFLISTLAKNQFVASQAAIISAFLPAFLLSGYIFEIASMPWLLRQLTRIIPARYLVTCLQTLFLVGVPWRLLLPNIAVLLLIAAIYFVIIALKTPKRLG